jgi:stage II sporulation protein E
MEKVEHSVMEPARNVDMENTRLEFSKGMKFIQAKLEWFFIQKGVALFIIGFLLGRALILSHLTPFALPFFASVYIVRRDRSPLALIGLLAGSLTISLANISYTFVVTVLFLLTFRLTQNYRKSDMKAVPFFVFFSSLFATLAFDYMGQAQTLTIYNGVMALVEASLTFILTYIFIQSIPLVTVNRQRVSLKTEEVVSLIILLASVMTGTIGWSLYNLSIEHILSRYLVILFSLIAGATVGSTVGVVTGLIFSLASVSSLYQMSLLAFSGLLGGLLKEGKKIGAAIGLLIATLLIGMYGESDPNLTKTLYESGVAILLLFLTPQSLMSKIAKHIPGTAEHMQEQQHYMRKVRDVTADRVTQFSSVFQALSNSFKQMEKQFDEEQEEKEFDYFLSNVTERTCQMCFKKEQCWSRNFDETYNLMKTVMTEYDEGNIPLSPRIGRELDNHCVKAKKVQDAIYQELTFYQANLKLKKQVQESRRLVAEQLSGVSVVMEDFAREIQRERENHQIQEEQIHRALQELGIDIENVEIYSLEQGSVDIDMITPYCGGHGQGEKLIAPMLSGILAETIIVQKEDCASFPNGQCHVTFRSAKKFVIDTGVAHAAKGGGLISGDSYSMIELGAGKYAVAISDGMGNGERAHYESSETLSLLQKILETGIDEQVAIKSVNSILSLRTDDEIFSTLDLAMIDLQDASSRFLKIGSTPSFIKRGDKVVKIEAGNLPMGIFDDVDVDVVSEQLKAEDLLIMMSDGAFEGPKHVENYDLWMKRKVKELKTDDPQEVADIIMEEVIRSSGGLIEDDMTIVVSKIKHNIPKWTSIPVQNMKPKSKKQIS